MKTLVLTSIPMEGPIQTRSTLYWRREPGAPADDLGVAWVIERDGTNRPINDGDPISSAEAKRLAQVGGHTLDTEPLEG